MYHHFLYPVQWWVIVSAWFLQLLLIVCSWLPFAMTQHVLHFQSTAILIVFYLSMLAINYRIHEGKIREFLFTESFSMDLTTSNKSSNHTPSLSKLDETKIISDYLAEMYDRTPSITTVEDMNDSASIPTTVSSVSYGTLDPSSVVSSVSQSRVQHRRPHHHDGSANNDDSNTATSTITDGRTPASSMVSERRNPFKPSLAKERSLY